MSNQLKKAALIYLLAICPFLSFTQGLNYEIGFNDEFNTLPDKVHCTEEFTFVSYQEPDLHKFSKLDSDGEILWTKSITPYGFPINEIVTDDEGAVYICGGLNYSCDSGPGIFGYLRKYDADGIFLWEQSYDFGKYPITFVTGLSLNGYGGVTVLVYDLYTSSIPSVKIYNPNGELVNSFDTNWETMKGFVDLNGFNTVGFSGSSILGYDSLGSIITEVILEDNIRDLLVFESHVYALLPNKILRFNNALEQEVEQSYAGFENLRSLKNIENNIQLANVDSAIISILSLDNNLQEISIEEFVIPDSDQMAFDFSSTHISIQQKYNLSEYAAVRQLDFQRNASDDNIHPNTDIGVTDIVINSFDPISANYSAIELLVLVKNYGPNPLSSFRLLSEIDLTICGPFFFNELYNNVSLAPQDSFFVSVNLITNASFEINNEGNPVIDICFFTADPNELVDINITNDQYCDQIEFILDCAGSGTNVGDACDDGNQFTENDIITEDCMCVGSLIYCENLDLFAGSNCDDGDPASNFDIVTPECDCSGNFNDPLNECTEDIIAYSDFFDCETFVENPWPFSIEDGWTVSNNYNGTDDATDIYPGGSSSVIWTLTDPLMNIQQCSQLVTVLDTISPQLECNASITFDTDSNSCSTFSPELGGVNVDDPCGIGSIQNDAPDFFLLGTSIVTWTVMDANGNSSTCATEINILDNQAPTIACGSDTTIFIQDCEEVVTLDLLPTEAIDNCESIILVNDYTNSEVSILTFTMGTTAVTWSAIDISNNTATCTQNITLVLDGDPSDLDEDGIIDECDWDIDGDGFDNEEDCDAYDEMIYEGASCEDGIEETINDMILADCSCQGILVGITETDSYQNKIKLFPNPASELLNVRLIDLEKETIIIQLFDVAGKSIFTEKIYNATGSLNYGIDLKEIAAGMYFIHLHVDGNLFTTRVTIDK